jgi:hypothetical protein
MTPLHWVILTIGAARKPPEVTTVTSGQVWMIVAGVAVTVLIGVAFLWLRRPVFRWYCRHCKKIISAGRFHPGRCTCGTKTLVAYFCKDCSSWDTTPTPGWHCNHCSSKDVALGVEYSLGTALWRWRNRPA